MRRDVIAALAGGAELTSVVKAKTLLETPIIRGRRLSRKKRELLQYEVLTW